MNTGDRPVFKDGLTTTIAWGLDGKISYALEGVIFISGATIQWLRDELKIIQTSADTEWYGFMVPDTQGVTSCRRSSACAPRTGTCTPAASWSA